ncbi:MAG: DUF6364 family protein [Saprospiraceae bacterium]
MDTKLTLKLDREIIEKAKRFAKQRNTSLSMLIENYFQNLTSREDASDQITPLVKSLSGIIEIPKGDLHKKEYTDYLMKKYS